MVKQSTQEDRNFDDLAKRFKRNIYDGSKGEIRLAVLNRDCAAHLPIKPFADSDTQWRILDAGGGQGQFSLRLAQAGHRVVICDISAEMLALAAAQVAELGLEDRVTLLHCAIQELPNVWPELNFDLVICHAVMEWMSEPQSLLPCLLNYVKPRGFISLTFYNLNAMIYKNLLRTNFKKVLERDFTGWRGSLTPINPQDPAQVLAWLKELPLHTLAHSGIRVFHDFIFNKEDRERDTASLLQLELAYSTTEPFRSLGRYMHLLLQHSV